MATRRDTGDIRVCSGSPFCRYRSPPTGASRPSRGRGCSRRNDYFFSSRTNARKTDFHGFYPSFPPSGGFAATFPRAGRGGRMILILCGGASPPHPRRIKYTLVCRSKQIPCAVRQYSKRIARAKRGLRPLTTCAGQRKFRALSGGTAEAVRAPKGAFGPLHFHAKCATINAYDFTSPARARRQLCSTPFPTISAP